MALAFLFADTLGRLIRSEHSVDNFLENGIVYDDFSDISTQAYRYGSYLDRRVDIELIDEKAVLYFIDGEKIRIIELEKYGNKRELNLDTIFLIADLIMDHLGAPRLHRQSIPEDIIKIAVPETIFVVSPVYSNIYTVGANQYRVITLPKPLEDNNLLSPDEWGKYKIRQVEEWKHVFTDNSRKNLVFERTIPTVA